MSVMFSPVKIGAMEVANRFVNSATYEAMATENGKVTDDLVKRYSTLARAGIGLIIPGYLFVHPLGRAMPKQTGIHSDDMIPGLARQMKPLASPATSALQPLPTTSPSAAMLMGFHHCKRRRRDHPGRQDCLWT